MRVSRRAKIESVRLVELLAAAVLGGLVFEQFLFPSSMLSWAFGLSILAAVVWFTLLRDRLLTDRAVSDDEVDAAPAEVRQDYDRAREALGGLVAAMDQTSLAVGDMLDRMIGQTVTMEALAGDRAKLRGVSDHLAEIRSVALKSPRQRSILGVLDGMREGEPISRRDALDLPQGTRAPRAPWTGPHPMPVDGGQDLIPPRVAAAG